MRNYRFVSVLLLGALSALFLLASCGPGQSGGPAGASTPAWVETDQWPDNRFTHAVPRPEGGEPYACAQGKSDGYEFFALALDGLDRKGLDAYLQHLADEGFQSVAEQAEIAPLENQVSVGDLFFNDQVFLSLAHSGETLTLSISLPEA